MYCKTHTHTSPGERGREGEARSLLIACCEALHDRRLAAIRNHSIDDVKLVVVKLTCHGVWALERVASVADVPRQPPNLGQERAAVPMSQSPEAEPQTPGADAADEATAGGRTPSVAKAPASAVGT